MIRHWIASALMKHGTWVTVFYRNQNGYTRTLRTKAVINIYKKGLEHSTADALLSKRTMAGTAGGKKLVLYLPFDVLDRYSGKGNIYVTIKGTDYVVLAHTSIPLGENNIYTWMICAPGRDVLDDFKDFDTEVDDNA